MAYAAELFFDTRSEEKIKDLWKALSDAGMGGLYGTPSRPHISLAVYGDLPVDEFLAELERFSSRVRRTPLRMESVGVFAAEPSAVFLSPAWSSELLRLHGDYHSRFEGYTAMESGYYLPGNWVPHCAVTADTKKNDAKDAVDIVLREFKPFPAEITAIGLVEFRPIRHLASFPMQPNP